MDWYLKVVRDNYANFSGRARRKEYWMFFLFNIIIAIAIGIADAIIGIEIGEGTGILGAAYSLALIIPSLAVSVRRLHDTGKSGWWILIGLIPLIGFLVLLIFYVREGDEGDNQYGPNPKAGAPDTPPAPPAAPMETPETPSEPTPAE